MWEIRLNLGDEFMLRPRRFLSEPQQRSLILRKFSGQDLGLCSRLRNGTHNVFNGQLHGIAYSRIGLP